MTSRTGAKSNRGDFFARSAFLISLAAFVVIVIVSGTTHPTKWWQSSPLLAALVLIVGVVTSTAGRSVLTEPGSAISAACFTLFLTAVPMFFVGMVFLVFSHNRGLLSEIAAACTLYAVFGYVAPVVLGTLYLLFRMFRSMFCGMPDWKHGEEWAGFFGLVLCFATLGILASTTADNDMKDGSSIGAAIIMFVKELFGLGGHPITLKTVLAWACIVGIAFTLWFFEKVEKRRRNRIPNLYSITKDTK
jgi:hypothetical protein